jgi:HlyD family secretion protein
MNRWIKRSLWLGLALAAGAGLAKAYAPVPLAIEEAVIDRGPLVVEVSADGRTQVKHRFVISAPIAGAVSRPELRPGDPVKRGAALLDLEPIDPPLLDVRTRAQAGAQVRLARAGRAQAEARVDLAKTSLDFERGELDRLRKLGDSGALPHAELDAAEIKVRTAEQNLVSVRLGVEAARYQVEGAEAAVLRASGKSKDTGGMILASPIDGAVLRVQHESGGVVAAGAPLIEIGDPGDLEVELDLLSTDAVRVKTGAAVAVERWGGEGDLAARVKIVEPSGFTKVSALGIEEQRVHVIADLTEPRERRASLGDGYKVEARVVIESLPDVVRVPLSALFRDGDEWAVFTVSAGVAARTSVSIGQRSGRWAEVLSGLTEGARVVLHPGDKLRDGAKVAPRIEGGSSGGARIASSAVTGR